MAVLKAPIDPNGLASSKVRSTPCHDKHAATKKPSLLSLGKVLATGLKQVQKDIMKSKKIRRNASQKRFIQSGQDEVPE